MNSPFSEKLKFWAFDLDKNYDIVINQTTNHQILFTGTYEQCRNYCNQNLLRTVYDFNNMRKNLEKGFIMVYSVAESNYNYTNPCGF